MHRIGIALVALVLLLATSGHCGDSWCMWVTDQAGDGKLTVREFALPFDTDAIYVSNDVQDIAQVYVEIEDGTTGVLLNSQRLRCGCSSTIIFSSVNPLPAGRLIRCRVAIEPCIGIAELSGQGQVNFFSPAEHECGPPCEGAN